MKKILGIVCLLAISFVTACKESEPKLLGAFGIKFGADIEDVRRELTKLGEIKDLGEIILTKTVPEPNPDFSMYTIISIGKIYDISAETEKLSKENDAEDLFMKSEKILSNQYGEPQKEQASIQFDDGSSRVKSSKWNIGQDIISLSITSDRNKLNQVHIGYRSINIQNELERELGF